MAIVIIRDKPTLKEIKVAREEYENYIKITIDLENKIVALGGEYHADAEKILLENGCLQRDIWGGGINLETGKIETNAIINLRGGRNDSTEILDSTARKKFINITRRMLVNYVRKS